MLISKHKHTFKTCSLQFHPVTWNGYWICSKHDRGSDDTLRMVKVFVWGINAVTSFGSLSTRKSIRFVESSRTGEMKSARTQALMIFSLPRSFPMMAWHAKLSLTWWGLEGKYQIQKESKTSVVKCGIEWWKDNYDYWFRESSFDIF